MTHDHLHVEARRLAELLRDPDKKQLKFNDIVNAARRFYNDPDYGVRELVESCDKTSLLYVAKKPMWQTLDTEYNWMAIKHLTAKFKKFHYLEQMHRVMGYANDSKKPTMAMVSLRNTIDTQVGNLFDDTIAVNFTFDPINEGLAYQVERK